MIAIVEFIKKKIPLHLFKHKFVKNVKFIVIRGLFILLVFGGIDVLDDLMVVIESGFWRKKKKTGVLWSFHTCLVSIRAKGSFSVVFAESSLC
jgi:hypothetical protein